MSFLAWTFLFGAAAVVAPIAAHLLARPRFKRVGFTMLPFLRSGQRQSHSRRKLRDLLILLLRCAVIVLIALLFAQPMLSVKPKPKAHRTIYHLALDDSMSMSYRDRNTTLWDRQTAAALERVREASSDDVLNIHALASGRTMADLTKDQAIAAIKQLTVVARSVRLEGFFSALRQAGQTASSEETISAVIFSDFSPKVLTTFDRIQEPVKIHDLDYELILPSELVDNAAIVGVRLANRVGTQLSLDVTVSNYGIAQERTLTAQAANTKPVSVELSLKAGRSAAFRIQMDLGPDFHRTGQVCWPITLSLSPTDHLADDDTYRFAACIPSDRPVGILLVHQDDDTFLYETAIHALSRSPRSDQLNLRSVAANRLQPEDFHRADIVVFASLPQSGSVQSSYLKSVTDRGGRLVFFVTSESPGSTAKRLWYDHLLPAFPDRWVGDITYLDSSPQTGASLDFDVGAARSLANYRMGSIAMKGHWQCQRSPEAECLWRFADGSGFLYGQAVGPGSSILVNTGIDDSLGLLAKSRAWPAFCQYLLGTADQMQAIAFATTERPVLHLHQRSQMPGESTTVAVENTDGDPATARTEGGALRMPPPAGLGWMKTLEEPALYAGVNLPEGETNVTPPAPEAAAEAVRRMVLTEENEDRAMAQAGSEVHYKPIRNLLAWAAMLLLLFESAAANRLKR